MDRKKFIPGTVTVRKDFDRMFVAWRGEDHRYHVWIDPVTKMIHGDRVGGSQTIYKNTLNEKGRTLMLDANASSNAPVIAAVFVEAHKRDLFAASIKAEADREAKSMEEHRENVRKNEMRNRGEDSYAVCDLLIHGDGTAENLQRCIKLATAVLDRVKKAVR